MPDGYFDDIAELQRRLATQKPPNPEWRPSWSYPIAKETSVTGEPIVVPPEWNTERSRNWVHELAGWGLDDDMPTEDRKRAMLTQKPPNVEWFAATQAPVAAGVIVGESTYWATVDPEKMSPKQRFAHEKRLARQDQFLAEIGQGTTTTEAARKIGVAAETITSWRRRYPEFDHRLDRAKAGLSDRTETDDSFVSRRLYYFGYETYEHHQRIVDAIESTPPGGVTMILLPPEAGKPVSVDAPIQMADGTIRRLGDVTVGDWVISGTGTPRPVSKVFEQGHLPTVEIRTGLGRSVTAALDHPFLTDRGWVDAGGLTSDDVLKVPAGYRCVPAHTPDTMQHRLAGYLIGDGMCRTKVAVTNNNPDLLADVETIGDKLGFAVKMEKNGRPFPGGEQSWNAILGNGARDLAKTWDLFNHTAHTKRVPEFVFRATDEGVGAFLAAYFACDGSIAAPTRTSVAIEIASVNRALCDDTQRLLARLGIRSRIVPHRSTYRGQSHLSWRITIGKKHQAATRFIEAVLPHLHHGPKRERLEAWQSRVNDTCDNLYDDPVIEVTDAGMKECRCLTVDVDHTFLASDLVVRNTTLLEDWCSDQIAQDPNTRILYVSEAAEGHSPAAKVLGTIKERMVDPDRTDPDAQHEQHLPAWNARFGPFHDPKLDKGKPWNAKYVKVSKASGRRDYTFQATSWRSKVYGTRTNWLIFDDVASLASIGETEKLLANIRLTFFSRPGQEGRTVFIGTRVGVGDIYERLIEELPEDILTVVQIPALDENGNSYCPEMWPIEQLERKRKLVGEDVWACAYMMAPHEASATTFDEELLDRARRAELTYGFLHHTPASTVLASIDPALGGGNAVIVAETTSSSLGIVAVQVNRHLGRNEKILMILRDMCRYGYSELVVEANSQQRGLARDERLKEMGTQFGFKVTEHETGVNKWEYAWGVSAMASSFISGEIHFPDATDRCRRQLEPFRAELLAWRPDVPTKLLRQDMVMALWFMWVVWKQRQRRMKAKKQQWKTGGTPWKPGDMSGGWQKRSPGGLVLR